MTAIALTRSATLATLLLAAGSATALADDLFPPPWRGQPDTTFAHWTFDNQAAPYFPDAWNNPYGLVTTPTVIGSYQYYPPPGVTGAASIGWTLD